MPFTPAQNTEWEGLLAALPNCVVGCFDEQSGGSCIGLDPACTCSSTAWTTPTLVCIGQVCNSTDAIKAENGFVKACTFATQYDTSAAPSPTGNVTSSFGSTTSAKTSVVAPIIGSIIGGFTVMIILGLVLWKLARKARFKKQRMNWEVDVNSGSKDDSPTHSEGDTESDAPETTPYVVTPPLPVHATSHTTASLLSPPQLKAIRELDQPSTSHASNPPVGQPSQPPPAVPAQPEPTSPLPLYAPPPYQPRRQSGSSPILPSSGPPRLSLDLTR